MNGVKNIVQSPDGQCQVDTPIGGQVASQPHLSIIGTLAEFGPSRHNVRTPADVTTGEKQRGLGRHDDDLCRSQTTA